MRFRMLPNKDLIFRLLNLNRVLLWCSVFRGESLGNEDNFLNSGCCAGPRFQAGKVPPLSPATSCFSSHRFFHSSTRQTGKHFIFDLGCSPRLLRVLARGHSADHGGCSDAGIGACSSGFERLRRQACCNFRDLVSGFDSLSSHHVDRVRPRSVCGDGDTK